MLAAICAIVAIAPPLAQAGKRVKYAGPVDLPALEPGLVAAPSIEFSVRFTKDGKKLKPKTVFPLKERNIYETCPTDRTSISPTDRPTTTSSSGFGFELGVKKGKFSGNDPLSNIEVSGKIAAGRHGERHDPDGIAHLAAGPAGARLRLRRSQLDRERRAVGAAPARGAP